MNDAPLKVIFAGTPDFAAEALQALIDSRHEVIAVYTQPDRPAGRGRKLKPGPVKVLAQAHNIEVRQPERLKDAEDQAALAALGADIMVVVAYGLLLPKPVLEAPRLGCINIHASLLPRWRGAAPIQRAILAGDSESGVTIMQMDEGLDTGDMLVIRTTPISDTDTAQTLHDRLAAIGAEAMLETLEQLAAGTAAPEKQDDAAANYAKKLSKAEALVDWTQSAIEIDRLVRAFNPWPVAHTTLDGQSVRIWEARAETGQSEQAPGTLLYCEARGLGVACGDGTLNITRLQLPGGKPVTPADLINARKAPQIGVRLGLPSDD